MPNCDTSEFQGIWTEVTVVQRILDLTNEFLCVPEDLILNRDTNLYDEIGVHSLDVLELCVIIEESFDSEFFDIVGGVKLAELRTVGDFAAHVWRCLQRVP